MVDTSYYGIKNAVGCKRLAELQEEDRKALEAAKKAEEERQAEEKRQAEEAEAERIAEYYKQIREENKKYLNQ